MQIIAENRRAKFDYQILETFEAGIELEGLEVKSAKNSRMGLAGSYAIIRNGEAWLLNAQIPAYQPNNTPKDYDLLRKRRLLLRKNEIASLANRLKEKGLSLIPLRAFVKRNLIKIELGLARPRKKHDKREILKKRAAYREMREMKK